MIFVLTCLPLSCVALDCCAANQWIPKHWASCWGVIHSGSGQMWPQCGCDLSVDWIQCEHSGAPCSSDTCHAEHQHQQHRAALIYHNMASCGSVLMIRASPLQLARLHRPANAAARPKLRLGARCGRIPAQRVSSAREHCCCRPLRAAEPPCTAKHGDGGCLCSSLPNWILDFELQRVRLGPLESWHERWERA